MGEHQLNKYLHDVLTAANLIEQFMEGVDSPDDFAANDLKQSAVERQFIIMGEALSVARRYYPDLDLPNMKSIIAYRNFLVHAYDYVDAAKVWVIIKEHLPVFKRVVEERLCVV